MRKPTKKSFILGIDLYRMGLACNTVIYSYYTYLYDAVMSAHWAYHLALYFLLPIAGCILYFLVTELIKLTAKIGSKSTGDEFEANYPNLAIDISKMNNQQKVELIEALKKSLGEV